MVDMIGPKFAAFLKLTEQIERTVKYEVGTARGLPNDYYRTVDRIGIGYSHYRDNDPPAQAAFNLVKEATLKSERERGERERDERLRNIAASIEALRAVLCDMAADACIELGCVARGLIAEAEKGKS